MKVYFVRHGQTDWNKNGKIMGRTDISLNEDGRRQAKEMRDKLKSMEFDVILTSPLKRTKETAEIIAEYQKNATIIEAKELVERDFGDYEGKINDGNYFGLWKYGEKIEKGENFDDMQARLNPFLDKIGEKYAGKKVLLVGHGGLGLLIGLYYGGEVPSDLNLLKYVIGHGELKEYRIQNTSTISLADLSNLLDKWIVSRVHELRDHITKYLDEYNLPDAMSAILPMVDDASNWYVRRSRRRFWKSEDDGDKNDAYRTLHYVMVYLSQILAPFVPFLAEELYQKLTGGESVHLLDWPEAGEVDEKVLAEMTRTREIIEKGLALRMDREDEFGQIKVRQPLAKLEYGGEKLDDFYEQIIADEVNVKAVIASNVKRSSNKKRLDRVGNELPRDDDGGAVLLDKELTPELKREGQAREIIRQIQNARKEAGLNVDDRIVVKITTDNKELEQAVVEHSETITAEILATKFADNDGYQTTASIDGVELKVQLKKA
jgi:broad specificity phosphatase PhoE